MSATYHQDIIEWSREQAELLRSGQFSKLDIEHLADEIEDVGKSEQRELENRMAVLLAHLLKWEYQPGRRSSSWQRTIREQRKGIKRRLAKTSSLKATLKDREWWEGVWSDAVISATKETDIDCFSELCPWTPENINDSEFFPQ